MTVEPGLTPFHLSDFVQDQGDLLALKTTLFSAVERGDTVLLHQLLSSYPQLLRITDAFGDTPLHRAAANGDPAVARLLLALGADLEARNMQNVTPLFLAVLQGHRGIVELLTGQGAECSLLLL